IFVILSLVTLAYLFRQIESTDPRLGRITYKMKWGQVREVLVDFNGDDITDLRGIYPRSAGEVSAGDPFEQHWESSRCNGEFDIHVTYYPGGGLDHIEYDSNQDGEYDTLSKNSEGEALLSRIREGGCFP
ncbi:MAG: hypothetical protein GY849_14015, partial [Deltaproteobacteria bacterium]|nr:hypothetical protein [Deltaproteobacteria bacterium]